MARPVDDAAPVYLKLRHDHYYPGIRLRIFGLSGIYASILLHMPGPRMVK